MDEEGPWGREFRRDRHSGVVATVSADVSINSSLPDAEVTVTVLLQVISVRPKQRCKDQIRRLCPTGDLQLKQVPRVRVSFRTWTRSKYPVFGWASSQRGVKDSLGSWQRENSPTGDLVPALDCAADGVTDEVSDLRGRSQSYVARVQWKWRGQSFGWSPSCPRLCTRRGRRWVEDISIDNATIPESIDEVTTRKHIQERDACDDKITGSLVELVRPLLEDSSTGNARILKSDQWVAGQEHIQEPEVK